jgi:immunity protein, SdpI family
LLVAWGSKVDVTATIAIATGLFFVVLGNFMGKIRPNWFVGVRTPWTLSSKLSWTKTHRLAGWLFIGMGILIAALGVVRTGWMFALTVSISVASVVGMFAYSYWVFRNDPDRTSPAGTSPGVE